MTSRPALVPQPTSWPQRLRTILLAALVLLISLTWLVVGTVGGDRGGAGTSPPSGTTPAVPSSAPWTP